MASEKGITQRALGSFLWMFSGTGANIFFQMIIMVFLARLLAPNEFGKVSAAMVIVAFARMLSQVGIGPAIVQIPQLRPEHIKTALSLSLIFGVLMGGLIVLFSPFLARFYRMPELIPIFCVLSVLFPLQGGIVVAESLLQRRMQFRQLAWVGLVSYVWGYGATAIVLAYFDFGVWALVSAIIVQTLVNLVLLAWFKPHSWLLGLDRQAARELISIGGGFTTASLFNYLALRGDYLVVGRWLGADALGYYTRSYSLMAKSVNLATMSMNKVLFANMASIQDDLARLRRAYLRSFSLVSSLVLPFSAVLIVLAPEIILTLLGPKWHEAVLPFQILALGIYFRIGYNISSTLSQAVGEVYRNAYRQGFYAAVVIGGAWIGQHWGIAGVAMAVLFALGMHFLTLSHLGLGVLALSWRDFSKVQLRGVFFGMLFGVLAWGTASFFRLFDFRPVIVLFLSLFFIWIYFFLMITFIPFFFLGSDGQWFVANVTHVVFRGKRGEMILGYVKWHPLFRSQSTQNKMDENK